MTKRLPLLLLVRRKAEALCWLVVACYKQPLDHDRKTLIKLRRRHYYTYLTSLSFGTFRCAAVGKHGNKYPKTPGGRLPYESGMKYLIESFYRSIIDSLLPPIRYREILLTSRMMEQIFEQASDVFHQDKARFIVA